MALHKKQLLLQGHSEEALKLDKHAKVRAAGVKLFQVYL